MYLTLRLYDVQKARKTRFDYILHAFIGEVGALKASSTSRRKMTHEFALLFSLQEHYSGSRNKFGTLVTYLFA